jgi:alpha-1,4-digalacturonate transport system permease protein
MSGVTQQKASLLKRIWAAPGQLISAVYVGVMRLLELVVDPLQRVIGMKRMAWFFLLPNLLIFSIFILFPMILNFYYSATGGTRLYPQDRPFVGTENFERLADCEDFTDPNSCAEDIFWRAIFNSLTFVSVQVVGMVAISLLTALILNQNIRGRGFFRSIYFYPVLLSPVVVGLIWKWILQREGLLNYLVSELGMEGKLWLLERDWAAFWVITVGIWAQMGFFTLILLAGLQSIPAVLYEASTIDGAGRWQGFRWVTLPLLMPTMFVVLVLSLIRAVQVFDQVFVLTGGGPGTATIYMLQYIYDTGFSNDVKQFGLAAAASVVLGLTLFILTMLQLRLARSTDEM